MEVWARIASFLPFPDLIQTFWTLRRAGALPLTYTTPSNALLQFCSESTEYDETIDGEYLVDQQVWNTLNEMGFSDERIHHAAQLCEGNVDSILEYLIHSS